MKSKTKLFPSNKKSAMSFVWLIVFGAVLVGIILYARGVGGGDNQSASLLALSPAAQFVTTYNPTNVTSTTATLNGYVDVAKFKNELGISEERLSYYFNYSQSAYFLRSITPPYGNVARDQINSLIELPISNLLPETKYYYRMCAGDLVTRVTRCGNTISFTTLGNSTITVTNPEGGEVWRIGQNYPISWTTTNPPSGSWVKLSYTFPGSPDFHATTECISSAIPATQGSMSWRISDSFWSCGDAGYVIPPDTTFETKIKAELFTGTPACEGYPAPGSPCLTGTRTLHAKDESNVFTITNEAQLGMPPCAPGAPDSIKFAGPFTNVAQGGYNGVYRKGQSFTVAWNSCGISNDSQVIIGLISDNSPKIDVLLTDTGGTKNDGQETFILPQLGGTIKARLVIIALPTKYGGVNEPWAYTTISDYSPGYAEFDL